MAIAEKSILDPEASKPGVPLKKSTLAVFVLLLLALGFISSLFLAGGKVRGQTPGPVVKDATALKKTGSDQTLKDEEAEAAKKAGQERAARAPATTARASDNPSAPLPAGSAPIEPVPPGVRRENNTSALFDHTGASDHKAAPGPSSTRSVGSKEDLELEAQTRMAKALVIDSDPLHADQQSSSLTRKLQDSGVFGLGSNGVPPLSQAPSAAVNGQIDAIRKQLSVAMGQGGSARPKGDWVREYAKETTTGGSPVNRGYQAPTRLVLRQGKVIPAVLGRQINSDLPGRITAYVSSNVYDDDGRLLIPMGSSLIGKYDSGVQVGQSRVMFAFERLVLPNGYSFNFPAAPGADLAGASGMSGDVDNHFFKMFGTSLLIALVADRTKQPQSVTALGSPGPVTAAGQVLSDVSKTILERNRVIPPTITVDQGTRINVEVVADMVFPEQYPLR